MDIRTRKYQAFKDLDKRASLAKIASEIWDDAVESNRAVVEPERLLRFLLLTFADLKKSSFLYWFAFPALGGQGLFRLASKPAPASSRLRTPAEAAAVVRGLSVLWARSVESTGRPGCPPYFVVVVKEGEGGGEGEEQRLSGKVRVLSLLEYEAEREGAENREGGEGVGGDGTRVGFATTVLFGFVDPCSDSAGTPGWPLRNFLVLLSARWGVTRASVLCFREFLPRAAAAVASNEGGPGATPASYVDGTSGCEMALTGRSFVGSFCVDVAHAVCCFSVLCCATLIGGRIFQLRRRW